MTKAAGKKRSKKKKKDPSKPKRAMSSFMFFANEHRPVVRKEHPDLKITDVGKKLGEMWKALDDDKKKKYIEMANKDKDRYKGSMEKYQPPESSSESDSDDSRKKKRKKKKKSKDPNKPKRSMSSFMFFANENRSSVRKEHPDLKITEVGKKLADMWKELSKEEKQKYLDMADKDKDRYKKAMDGYKPGTEEPPSEEENASSDESSEQGSSGEPSDEE